MMELTWGHLGIAAENAARKISLKQYVDGELMHSRTIR